MTSTTSSARARSPLVDGDGVSPMPARAGRSMIPIRTTWPRGYAAQSRSIRDFYPDDLATATTQKFSILVGLLPMSM